jgi:hypothetical protein
MNEFIIGIKESICCGFVGSFYWIIMSWYVIAYTLLCCGCPTGILGKKRFPSKLWGPYIEDPSLIAAGALAEGKTIVEMAPTKTNNAALVTVTPAPAEDTHLLIHAEGEKKEGEKKEGEDNKLNHVNSDLDIPAQKNEEVFNDL